ncbi:MAG: AAA family ATPase [Candidatus Stygibacter australis]|nr:AAA family ATPase [Candidatus Stygibacter australis]
MELIYFWIEKFNNFRKQGVNLGGDKIFYDEEIIDDKNQLNLKCKDNINSMKSVLDFLEGDDKNNIINITGVVGKNGSGKTMLLRYLLNRLTIHENESKENDRFCLIFKGNNQYIYFSTFRSIDCSSWPIKKIENLNEGEFCLPVYYSNCFLKREYLGATINNYRYLSTENLITGYYLEDYDSGDKDWSDKSLDNITKYEIMETVNEAQFLSEAKKKECLEIFINKNDLPRSLKANYLVNHLDEMTYMKRNDKEKDKSKMLLKLDSENNFQGESYSDKIYKFINRLIRIHRNINKGKQRNDHYRWKLEYIGNVMLEFIYKVTDYYHLFKQGLGNLNSEITEEFDQYYDIVNSFFDPRYKDKYILLINIDQRSDLSVDRVIFPGCIDNIISIFIALLKNLPLNNRSQIIYDNETGKYFENSTDMKKDERYDLVENRNSTIQLMKLVHKLDVNAVGFINFETGDPLILEFLELYGKSSIAGGNFKFEWERISSGQWSQLKLFSRLHYFKKKNMNKSNNKNILLLLDEPDQYFHPEWQRTMIHNLITYIGNFFAGYKVQIVYSTNNPMTMSDIPVNNLVFLKKGKDDRYTGVERKAEETFAANIYDLYNDGFYLKEFIGELPKIIIEKILRELNDKDTIDKNRADQLGHLILLVGDNIIRRKLIDMLSNRIDVKHKDEWIDDTIRLLEKKKRDNVSDKR